MRATNVGHYLRPGRISSCLQLYMDVSQKLVGLWTFDKHMSCWYRLKRRKLKATEIFPSTTELKIESSSRIRAYEKLHSTGFSGFCGLVQSSSKSLLNLYRSREIKSVLGSMSVIFFSIQWADRKLHQSSRTLSIRVYTKYGRKIVIRPRWKHM